MKFFIALLVSVITAVKAMALDPLGSPLAARDDHSVTTTYPNGTTKVELFSGGVYVGAAIEDGDSVFLLDASGNDIGAAKRNEIPEGIEVGKLAKRVWIWDVLKQWAEIIKKYGIRVVQFIYCIDLDLATECWDKGGYQYSHATNAEGDQFYVCATHGNTAPPWLCGPGLICVGKAGKKCI